jgi:plasmid rolling circle replication initiator protein Rep
MEIITQVITKIKDDTEKNEKILASEEKYGAKWTQKKLLAKEVAKKFRQIGEHGRAARMENCAEVVAGRICGDCGQMMVDYANLCRDRFCPVCKWRLSMQRFANMLQIVTGLRTAYPEAEWQFVTLTAKNCPVDKLNIMLDEMNRCWNCIASSKKFKEQVAGWAKSVEITHNSRTGELHPHFHMILMYHEGHACTDYVIKRWLKGVRLTTSELAQCAEKITWAVDNDKEIGGQMWEDDIDRAAIDAILETFKYATKDSEILQLPTHAFFLVTRLLANRRLISFGGLIKEYAKACEIDRQMDDVTSDQDDESVLEICCRCKSRKMIDVVAKWCGQAYIWRRVD